MRYNPPPNWPQPPEGWTSPRRWAPDPAWGPPPVGWELWVNDAAKAARAKEAARAGKQDAKEYVRSHRAEVIRSFQKVHLFPDRLIKLPAFGAVEQRPINGVSASLEESGTISSRTTLTRSLVPGMHGWQKQQDNRKGFVVLDGPDFQWRIEYVPSLTMGGPQKFVTAVNTAARAFAHAHPATPSPSTPTEADPLEQLKRLGELRELGVLSDEEFTAKKSEILGRI